MERNILSVSNGFILIRLIFSHYILCVNGVFNPIHTICAVPGYDYFNLTALPWFVSVKQPACLPLPNNTLSRGTKVSQCLILMRFCQTLKNFGNGCQKSSVCQQSSQGDVSLGAFIDNPFIGYNVSDKGFQASIPKGASYRTTDGTPCEVKTLVNFQCNHSVKWDAPSSYVGIKRAPDPQLVKYDANNCELQLSFHYAGACPWKKSEKEGFLSIGSVALIVFSVSFAIYFILGCFVNVAIGNSGSEVIPHVTFWSSLVGYIADGFKFVFCAGVKPVRAVAYEKI